MAVRTDLTIDYALSPRIITVASPSVVLTIQDLHDTLHTIQSEPRHLNFDNLLISAGKDDLGGGTLVGITLRLLNARVAFAARGGPSFIQCFISGGNIVAEDSNGDSINPIEPTAFTQVVVAQSSSATISETDVAGPSALTAEQAAQLAAALSRNDFVALK